MSTNGFDLFRYMPITKPERQRDLFVPGTGYTLAPPNTRHLHPEPYFFHWEDGRTLPQYAVFYVTEGEQVEFENEATGKEVLCAGDIAFLFPGVWHRYWRREDVWAHRWVHFGGAYADHLLREGLISPRQPVLHAGINRAILAPFLRLFQRVHSEPRTSQPLMAADTMDLLDAIVAQAKRQPRGRSAALARRAAFFLQQHSQDVVDLKELAATLHISYERLREVFKAETGLAPYQYHLRLRIERAKTILRESSLSVREVAFQLNFENPYHFSRIFKEKTGVSPSQWRLANAQIPPA